MFLLEFDMTAIKGNLPVFPEITLWENFEDALAVAMSAAFENGVVVDHREINVDVEGKHLFIPDFCEILPITVSTREKMTWLGNEFKMGEEVDL